MKHILFSLTLLAGTLAVRAAEAPDAETQLREQLRAALLQLRTAQTEAANQQALQAAARAKTEALELSIESLETRNAKLVDDANKDRAASEQTIATLNDQLAEREKRLVQYGEALGEWKAGYQKAADIARTKESERAALASEAIVLRRTIADRDAKNIALFNVANEILDRFENYALGKAIAAREPFIGTSRVKVENLAQAYQDRIIDNRIAAPAAKP